LYGPNAEKPDLDPETYEVAAKNIMNSLAATPQRISEVEELTRQQADSELWRSEREKRITAYRFKRICSLQETTSTAVAVKEIVKSSFFGNASTEYGKTFEPVARSVLEKEIDMKVEDCGLHIHRDHCFLGASPDGKISEINYLVKIKCFPSLPAKKVCRNTYKIAKRP